MATTIVTKSGSGAPTASDLVAGELAVDLTNGRLYTENSGGTVLELGLNPNGNVNVTGSVTADGLTVDGSALVRSGNTLTLNRTDNAVGGAMSYVAGTGFIFNDANGDGTSFNAGALNRMRLASNGDLSLYEDTGTTPKLFWDASAESLGIGVAPYANTLSSSIDSVGGLGLFGYNDSFYISGEWLLQWSLEV